LILLFNVIDYSGFTGVCVSPYQIISNDIYGCTEYEIYPEGLIVFIS
jgi:hypothetical protein